MTKAKSKPVDPIAALMRRRRAAPNTAYSSDDVDKLLNRFKELQEKVDSQKEMISTLEREALADPVTGLANRRTLEGELEKSLSTARRYGRRHALLWVEVADFENYAKLSPGTDEAILVSVSRIIRQNIRATDIASRPHGGVFGIILNELRVAENANARADEISRVIAATPCLTPRNTLHLEVEVGICVFGADDELSDVLVRAEHDLSRRKTGKA